MGVARRHLFAVFFVCFILFWLSPSRSPKPVACSSKVSHNKSKRGGDEQARRKEEGGPTWVAWFGAHGWDTSALLFPIDLIPNAVEPQSCSFILCCNTAVVSNTLDASCNRSCRCAGVSRGQKTRTREGGTSGTSGSILADHVREYGCKDIEDLCRDDS
eukprot:1209642-Rhodomonas_salina.1